MSINPQYEVQDVDPLDVDASLDEAQMVADDKEVNGLPEAPAVANVKVWIKGYGVIFTVRGEKMLDIVKKTITLVDFADSHGWKNTWDKEIAPERVLNSQAAAQQIKNCSIHGTPMQWKSGIGKTSGKPYAFWSCSQKLADGSWCNGKPME